MEPKRVVILGSTGSIGVNTLKVIERFPKRFKVVGLSAFNNAELLEAQIRRFLPTHAAVGAEGFRYLRRRLPGRIKILELASGLEELAGLKAADIVVIAMSGSAALRPFLAAVRRGRTIAPANKEALVIAGDLIMREALRHQARIIPVDSEQSAIFQCLEGRSRAELRKIYLTASGGVLLHVPVSRFDKLSIREILRHPRWKMGKKITVDSATLMNKGFEVIEASRLFGVKIDAIEVMIHPEAVIHSMVEFRDGSVIAQLGVTDMRLPIQYALNYPERLESGLDGIDFFKLKQLTFQKPDLSKFPSLALAIYAGQQGGTMPAVLNAADEEAVQAFLNGKIRLRGIYTIIERVLMRHKIVKNPVIKDILAADGWAREESLRFIGAGG